MEQGKIMKNEKLIIILLVPKTLSVTKTHDRSFLYHQKLDKLFLI